VGFDSSVYSIYICAVLIYGLILSFRGSFVSLGMKIQSTCEAEINGFYFRCNDRLRLKWTSRINYICEMDVEFSLASFSLSVRLYHFIEELQDRLKKNCRLSYSLHMANCDGEVPLPKTRDKFERDGNCLASANTW